MTQLQVIKKEPIMAERSVIDENINPNDSLTINEILDSYIWTEANYRNTL